MRRSRTPGYTPATLCESRNVGVFVGVTNGYYPSSAQYLVRCESSLLSFRIQRTQPCGRYGVLFVVDGAAPGCRKPLRPEPAIVRICRRRQSDCRSCALPGIVRVDDAFVRQCVPRVRRRRRRLRRRRGRRCRGPEAARQSDCGRGSHLWRDQVDRGQPWRQGRTAIRWPSPTAQKELVAGGAAEGRDQRAGASAISRRMAPERSWAIRSRISGLTQAFAQDTQDKQFLRDRLGGSRISVIARVRRE